MRKRNNYLDLVKFISFCMVVFIHCPFPEPVGECIIAISRCAVPIFLTISGIFYKHDFKKCRYNAIKYGSMYLIFSAIWTFVYSIIKTSEFTVLAQWSNLKFDFLRFILFIVLGYPFGNEYLWYLHALAGSYLTIYLIEEIIDHLVNKKGNYKRRCKLLIEFTIIYILIILLISLGIEFVSGYNVPTVLWRNFAIEGTCLFLLGQTIREIINARNDIKISIRASIIMCIIGLIITLIEWHYTARKDLYFGSLIICFFALIVFENVSIKESFLVKFSRKYSLLLYLVHPFVILIIQLIELKITNMVLLNYYKPFLTIALTCLIVPPIHRCITLIKK